MKIQKTLSSMRTAIFLLILLAGFGALGTLQPWPQGLSPEDYEKAYGFFGRIIVATGLDSFHKSLLYRGIFLLFSANLLVCGVKRSAAGIRDFAGRGTPAGEIPFVDRELAVRALGDAGFAVSGEGTAWRRRWGFLGFPLVHLAPIAVALGAFIGSVFGLVATENAYVGDAVYTVYEWAGKRDVDLPFAIHIEDRVIEYFPGEIRLRAILPGGAESEEFTADTGAEVRIPGSPYTAVVESFSPDDGNLSYLVQGLGPFSRGKEEGAPAKLRPVAFRGFETKKVVVPLEIYSPVSGNLLHTHTLSVNDPLMYEGYKVYLTAWGADDAGERTVGLQITRDPGEWLMWMGSVLLSVGIFLLLFADSGYAVLRGNVIYIKCSAERLKILREKLGEKSRDDT